MKLGEIYRIYFNSNGKNVVETINNSSHLIYRVPWYSILPDKYKRFHCEVVFKTDTLINAQYVNAKDSGFVIMDGLRINGFDGVNNSSNIISYFYLKTFLKDTSTVAYTNEGYINKFTMSYPTTDLLSVRFKDLVNDDYLDDMAPYLLTLIIQGIEEE